MPPWLSGHAIWRPQRRTTDAVDAGLAVLAWLAVPAWLGRSGGRWGTDAVCAGLRWLTGRWPGGTIGNEAEVYSG